MTRPLGPTSTPMAERFYCKRHPDVLTRLRCGSCEDPICPKCMVHAHVGVRCMDCGKAVVLPTYQVSGFRLVRAAMTSLAVGAVTGLIYGLVLYQLGPLFGTLLLVGIGIAVAEAATVAAGRRRGRTMQYVVGSGIIVAVVAILVVVPVLSLWTLIGAVIGFVVGTNRVA